MGMASYYEDDDLPLIDEEGFKEYVKRAKAGEIKVGNNSVTDWVEALEIVPGAGDKPYLTFRGLNEWKIISYWYKEFMVVLRDIAVFVGEGWTKFSFETDDEVATIHFDGEGGFTIELGEMKYQTLKPEDFRRDLPEPIDMIKKRMLVRKI